MVRFLSLLARWSVRLPPLLHIVRWVLPNPLALLAGKPLERRLLIYDAGDHKLALTNDPECVEAVLFDRKQIFPKSALLESLLHPLIGRGVFGQPGGAGVKAARRLFIRALARIDDEEIAQVSRRITQEYVRRWVSASSSATVPICTELSRLTVDIVSQCTLSQRFSAAESHEFARLFFDYHGRCVPLPLLLAERDQETYRRAVQAMGLEQVGAKLRSCVAARFLMDPGTDSPALRSSPFGAVLAESGLLDTAATPTPAAQEALDEIMVMLLAGHETTASVMSWLCWELARRPPLQQAVAARLDGCHDQGDEHRGRAEPVQAPCAETDPEQILHGLTREALRLYPPIAFFLRDVAQDTVFRGKQLPRGAFMVVSPWALHRHRKRWDQPDAFLPERWWSTSKDPTRTDFLPFGIGPRTCPGARFAEIEMREILRVLLAECRFSVVDRATPTPLGSLTSRPSREIHLIVQARGDETLSVPRAV